VNSEVQEGEFLSIMGPSGCGKSTLLNIMGLLDTPTSGTITINGTTTEGMGDKELAAFRNKTLGFVFQSFHLINSLNVLDNVELPLLYRKMSASERTALAKSVLERVGLSHRMRHMPTQLSGGQCQRVAIARALALKPKILCFDEPTSALDPELTGEVLRVIRSLKDEGCTMLIVTHEMEFAKNVSDNVVFMSDGVVEECGLPLQLFNNPASEKLKAFLHGLTNKD
jgi:putative ABC transport system ATP-binding protein